MKLLYGGLYSVGKSGDLKKKKWIYIAIGANKSYTCLLLIYIWFFFISLFKKDFQTFITYVHIQKLVNRKNIN